MKHLMILAVVMTVIPYPASANQIERACNQSPRSDATRSLCACIGNVADMTLSRSQMREGARFFSDPQRAQDVRMSDRRSDEQMWQAWRNFGETAEQLCG